ncbi:hypothetical protein NE237_015060 [Protea cynaroides]|uniref:Uncharacterized protein n=1 Tax=Protea cynaroides TaxID=273540 RepID=A0A9Q0KDB8_9MAGN|nr:hypothetical protein NE237_015060 [Protea cynaroides]
MLISDRFSTLSASSITSPRSGHALLQIFIAHYISLPLSFFENLCPLLFTKVVLTAMEGAAESKVALVVTKWRRNLGFQRVPYELGESLVSSSICSRNPAALLSASCRDFSSSAWAGNHGCGNEFFFQVQLAV